MTSWSVKAVTKRIEKTSQVGLMRNFLLSVVFRLYPYLALQSVLELFRAIFCSVKGFRRKRHKQLSYTGYHCHSVVFNID